MVIKTIAHVHSTYSYDGVESLQNLKEMFKQSGIQCVLMSEHTDKITNVEAQAFIDECRLISDKDIMFIPGFEVPYKKAHILMFGARGFVSNTADEISLVKWRENVALSVLAHPHRNDFVIDTVMRSVIDGVEVWNSQYDGKIAPRFAAIDLCTEEDTVRFAGLDFHRVEHKDGPIMEVETEEFSEIYILQALAKGNFTIVGNEVNLPALGLWNCGTLLRLKSKNSILLIEFSKRVNKLLHSLGISLPKKLKEKIRSKI